jgi:hypothetical protein
MSGSLLRQRDVQLIVGAVGVSALGDFLLWIPLTARPVQPTSILDYGSSDGASWNVTRRCGRRPIQNTVAPGGGASVHSAQASSSDTPP